MFSIDIIKAIVEELGTKVDIETTYNEGFDENRIRCYSVVVILTKKKRDIVIHLINNNLIISWYNGAKIERTTIDLNDPTIDIIDEMVEIISTQPSLSK